MAKAIMIQGTSSGAGKSLLAAGLCRVLRQDGLRVAPFKAQNMSLNSFVTRDGLEMGRAQAVQAQAAGVEPSALMNPILLKPQSDTGSQVIVEGEVWDTLPAWDYFRRKGELLPRVRAAYEALAARYDIIVIEGAGSPAEINLRSENDFVNMGMAKIAGAPVLLTGDIDRGGVFASLYGTLALLAPDERPYVRGTIINKFRGDASILRPGLAQLEELTGVPVVGVVPMLDIALDEEDSQFLSSSSGHGAVDIAVPRFPRISNFTDLAPLAAVPGVSVRYVSSPREWGRPDLVLLPGSKSTAADLLWMRRAGLDRLVTDHAARGGAVFGICGGYQMLGRTIRDPEGVEGGGEVPGLGLLPVSTDLRPRKTRAQVTGRFAALPGVFAPLSGVAFEGYEIHMGETESPSPAVLVDAPGGERPGGCAAGNVCGCYVHGVFDRGAAASALLGALCADKGLPPLPAARDAGAAREEQFDSLAWALRQSLDLAAVRKIIAHGL